MSDIFVSYARPDEPLAKRAADALVAAGYSVWRDEELPAHRVYGEVIEERVKSAKAVVVLWSSEAVKSQWVRSEADAGRAAGKIVQASLDGTTPPMPFDQIQCADLRGWDGRADAHGWRKLLGSVAALVGEQPASAPAKAISQASGEPVASRRGIIAGAAATAGVAALGGGAWAVLRNRKHDTPLSPQTAALMQQAKIALWQNTHEGQNQAIGLYRQVVSDNPTYADGWGYLSSAYSLTAHYRQTAESNQLRTRALSAARQGLELDPGNAVALVGEATARPFIGNWMPIDKALRNAVGKRPQVDDLSFNLALFLGKVGRAREALEFTKSVLAAGPTPAIYFAQATLLWSAGRQEELDSLLTEARKLYPTHFALWFVRFYTDMLSGRPEAALALAADTDNRPSGIEPSEIDSVVRVAHAIQSPSPETVDAVVQEWMERAHRGAGHAENAAQFMIALGRIDDAFAVLRAYFFSEGFDCGEIRFAATQGTYTPHNDRLTTFLFTPALAPVFKDARFGDLTRRLGLDAYWKATGKPPDFLSV